ncbi:hypothetical protein Plec18167_006229 [Paecilomyces lecythidis]|uniref:DUF7820 domain-containing protein n=1 Tax=Paecilomyces lecythidis TaxID=3004212 RepID=A0ABR3XDD0_9EURO
MAGRVPSRDQSERSRYRSSQSSVGTQDHRDSLSRRSLSNRFSNPNVFSDEFSLDPLDAPDADRVHRNPSVSSHDSSITLRSNNYVPVSSKPSFPDTVPPPEVNPFDDNARSSLDDLPNRSSLPQKGGIATNRNSTGTVSSSVSTPTIARRSLSTSSHFSMPRAQSPYTGATGPSHPYAMYPQVGVSRSPSVTTTSTVRGGADRPLMGATAPQHPYAMYPQNILPEEGMDDDVPAVGFPGHTQPYQRPPGRADDDVGDIIGPDGHLEQLPPYSRYPDGIPPKIGMGPASIASANREREMHDQDWDATASGGASGLSSRTMLPEESPTRLPPPPPPPAPVESEPAVDSFEEKIKRKSRQRMCFGIPIWMFVLIAAVLIIGAAIGGVIGGVLGAQKGEQSGAASASSSLSLKPASVVTVTATSHTDATPLATVPGNLLPLPTGKFQIPASVKNQSKFCMPSSSFWSTWGCMSQGSLEVEVDGRISQSSIKFQDEPISGTFTYGAQAPVFSNPVFPLHLMLDKEDTEFGPALFFDTQFDKLVIVDENTFPTPTGSSKRSVDESELLAAQWSRKTVASAGDKPWFCWWNGTAMEFFMYLNQTTHDADTDATPISTPTTASPTRAGSTKLRRNYLGDYPRRIKIEEKRNSPNAQQPYCVQMQVLDDGEVSGPINQFQIAIDEVEPAQTTTIAVKRDSAASTSSAQGSYQSTCYCESLTD